jgi:hypothetical protein
VTQPPVFPPSPPRYTPFRSTFARNESALSIEPQSRDSSKISFLELLAERDFDLDLRPSLAASVALELWTALDAIHKTNWLRFRAA